MDGDLPFSDSHKGAEGKPADRSNGLHRAKIFALHLHLSHRHKELFPLLERMESNTADLSRLDIRIHPILMRRMQLQHRFYPEILSESEIAVRKKVYASVNEQAQELS